MDPVNPEFTITVLEARIKSLSSELEQMTKHANEGWALANTRTAQSKSIELQIDEVRKLFARWYTEEIDEIAFVGLMSGILKQTENPKGDPTRECICGTTVSGMFPCAVHPKADLKRKCEHKTVPTFDGLGVRYKCQLCGEYISE